MSLANRLAQLLPHTPAVLTSRDSLFYTGYIHVPYKCLTTNGDCFPKQNIIFCEIGNEILNTVLGFVRGTALPVHGYGRNSCRLVLHSVVTHDNYDLRR